MILKQYYTTARGRFRIPRTIMASVNFVETKFGRVLGPSSAGARGPMQFLPSTWDAYGNGGNIWDPHDAIMGAGRYLEASGAPERMYDALHAYNPSDAYVRTILIYADQMRRKPFRYLNYYWWQVFVRTKDGAEQMTGPGTRRWRY
jgi:membrane-bound lytic murein transglycosylase B